MLYTTTQIGFILLTAVCYGMVLKYLKQSLQKSEFSIDRQKKIFRHVSISLALWMAFVSAMSVRGFFSNFDTFPPRMVIVLFVPLITLIWALLISKTTKELLPYLPEKMLTGLQFFRFLVEILLWMLFIQNLLPEQMTFEGLNFDILAGITGPVVAYLAYHKKLLSRRMILLWNVLCLGLLINIVTIALLSMPSPFRYFMNEPSNTIVAEFPIIWLPAFLVPLAYGLHFLSIRQLINRKN